MLEALTAAKLEGRFLLIHSQTKKGELASLTVGRCFQSEPDVLLLGFEPQTAKGQLKEILHALSQTFGIPSKIEDQAGKTLYCKELTLKEWFQSESQVPEAVTLLTQSIPIERLKDFLELGQVLVFSATDD